MRVLLKVNIPVEAGNRAAREGTLGKTIQQILTEFRCRNTISQQAKSTPRGLSHLERLRVVTGRS